MTITRATVPKAAILALATLTFGTACGAVAEVASTDGETQSEVVSGESTNAEKDDAEASPAQSEDTEEAVAELKVVDHGFTQLDGGEYGEPGVTYGVVIKNSGNGIATDAQVQISFVDSEGTVVDTREEYLTAVLPGTSVALGDYLYDANGVTKMTVQAMPGQTESLEEKPANFTVSKVNTRAEEYGGLKTTATVESPFTKDLKDLQAVAVYRDQSDKIIGGAFTFLNFVPAGGKASVSIESLTDGLTPASTDVHIALSGLTMLD